jgi:hypothetical protein
MLSAAAVCDQPQTHQATAAYSGLRWSEMVS